MAKKQILKGKADKHSSPISGLSKSNDRYEKHITFSFKDLDVNQNQKETFEIWESENLLLKLLNKIKDVSKQTVDEAKSSKVLNHYGSFPPSHKTKYKVPAYLSEELQWCSLHIQGKEVLAGHMYENVFYIVFLDKDHHFWISEKKHT